MEGRGNSKLKQLKNHVIFRNPAWQHPSCTKRPGTRSAGLHQVLNRCERSPSSASGCSSCFKCHFNPSFHLPHSLFDRGDMSAGKGRSGNQSVFPPAVSAPHPKTTSLTTYQPNSCFSSQAIRDLALPSSFFSCLQLVTALSVSL